ncbi:ATP-binding protein [Streptomyces sp. URMC 123]|uniref:ATP-binding protein n=1 Tax=Streptomyces sp. URMC 123 TaxID=3423403 RepID=UPI003F1DCD76
MTRGSPFPTPTAGAPGRTVGANGRTGGADGRSGGADGRTFWSLTVLAALVGGALAAGLLTVLPGGWPAVAAAAVTALLVLGSAWITRLRQALAAARTDAACAAALADARGAEMAHLAGARLPAILERTRNGQGMEGVPGPIATGATGEGFGRAVAAVVTALGSDEAARRERMLRDSVQAAFESVARNMHAMSTVQQQVLDGLGRLVTDPLLMAEVMKADHAAAQMTRKAQTLLVMCGIWPARRETRPVTLFDCVRGAQSRIVEFARVDVHGGRTLYAVAPAVEGLMHAIAELLENATVFSPSRTQVVVSVREVAAGAVIEIDDAGLGMPPDVLEQAKAQLTEGLDLAQLGAVPRLGLACVGRWSRELGFGVELSTASAYGGTRVVVFVPHRLLTEPVAAEQGSAAMALPTPATGQPAALTPPGATPPYGTVHAPPALDATFPYEPGPVPYEPAPRGAVPTAAGPGALPGDGHTWATNENFGTPPGAGGAPEGTDAHAAGTHTAPPPAGPGAMPPAAEAGGQPAGGGHTWAADQHPGAAPSPTSAPEGADAGTASHGAMPGEAAHAGHAAHGRPAGDDLSVVSDGALEGADAHAAHPRTAPPAAGPGAMPGQAPGDGNAWAAAQHAGTASGAADGGAPEGTGAHTAGPRTAPPAPGTGDVQAQGGTTGRHAAAPGDGPSAASGGAPEEADAHAAHPRTAPPPAEAGAMPPAAETGGQPAGGGHAWAAAQHPGAALGTADGGAPEGTDTHTAGLGAMPHTALPGGGAGIDAPDGGQAPHGTAGPHAHAAEPGDGPGPTQPHPAAHAGHGIHDRPDGDGLSAVSGGAPERADAHATHLRTAPPGAGPGAMPDQAPGDGNAWAAAQHPGAPEGADARNAGHGAMPHAAVAGDGPGAIQPHPGAHADHGSHGRPGGDGPSAVSGNAPEGTGADGRGVGGAQHPAPADTRGSGPRHAAPRTTPSGLPQRRSRRRAGGGASATPPPPQAAAPAPAPRAGPDWSPEAARASVASVLAGTRRGRAELGATPTSPAKPGAAASPAELGATPAPPPGADPSGPPSPAPEHEPRPGETDRRAHEGDR